MEDMIKYFRQFKKWNSEPVPDDEWPFNEVREKPSKGFRWNLFKWKRVSNGNAVMRFAFRKKKLFWLHNS